MGQPGIVEPLALDRAKEATVESTIYGMLATLTVAVHLGFIVFVMFGALLALRWRWAPWLHLPAAAWGAFVELTGRVCPLTPLEQAFRRAAGSGAYSGDFIDRYLVQIVYPSGLTREMQVALGLSAVLLNVALYAWVVRRLRSEPAR